MEQTDYTILVHKSLTGSLSAEENRILTAWSNESEANRSCLQDIATIWNTEGSTHPFSTAYSGQRVCLLHNLALAKKKEQQVIRIHHRLTASLVFISLVLGTLTAWQLAHPRPVSVHFHNDHIAEITETLEQQYHIDVTVTTPQQLPCTFTGSFVGQDIEEVMKTIGRSMGFTYTFKNGIYYIKGQCRRAST